MRFLFFFKTISFWKNSIEDIVIRKGDVKYVYVANYIIANVSLVTICGPDYKEVRKITQVSD